MKKKIKNGENKTFAFVAGKECNDIIISIMKKEHRHSVSDAIRYALWYYKEKNLSTNNPTGFTTI